MEIGRRLLMYASLISVLAGENYAMVIREMKRGSVSGEKIMTIWRREREREHSLPASAASRITHLTFKAYFAIPQKSFKYMQFYTESVYLPVVEYRVNILSFYENGIKILGCVSGE